MMPPKAPIWSDVMPRTLAVAPSMNCSTPPVRSIMAEMAECITRNATPAERAATSFSARAMPIATPMAKMSGRLSKMTPPHAESTVKTSQAMVPGPMMPSRLYVARVVSLVNELPRPMSRPATGSTAMGSMNERPTR